MNIKFLIVGAALCLYLGLSHSRGWLLFSTLGSRHAPPPGPRGAGLFHK